MKLIRTLIAGAVTTAFAFPSISQASVTYSHTGLAFTVVDSWLNTNGNLLGNKNVFSFTFDNALGANLNMQSVSGLVTNWEASVVNTPRTKVGSSVANSNIDLLKFSTDALGNITNWAIYVTGFTDDIYHNGILGMEALSESPGTDAIAFYNPLGYRATWPYRGGAIQGVTGDNYGLAYCMGFSCTAGNEPAWQVTSTPPANGNGNFVPEPASLALIGLGLAGLSFSRRKKA